MHACLFGDKKANERTSYLVLGSRLDGMYDFFISQSLMLKKKIHDGTYMSEGITQPLHTYEVLKSELGQVSVAMTYKPSFI